MQGNHLSSISHRFHLCGRNLYKILDSCKQLTVSQSSGDDDTTGMVTIITGFQLEDPSALSAPMQVGHRAVLSPGAAQQGWLALGGLGALCHHSAGSPKLSLELGAPLVQVGAPTQEVGAPWPCLEPLGCAWSPLAVAGAPWPWLRSLGCGWEPLGHGGSPLAMPGAPCLWL